MFFHDKTPSIDFKSIICIFSKNIIFSFPFHKFIENGYTDKTKRRKEFIYYEMD
ncbi:hypothetical protein EUBHAL_02259 [Anaerobutyricum hallii DSM 3353]|uniref:Uncharacterized protein n=1 Tax=Anaerobutyricum hallii DSM 3353 TaxID=411469 RepID=C0EXV7_9FIRM|nr:hypothetical protein EUBHAL_02259 [Anaerobutyricum hallii DSM 3353]